jgi:hypothetical protein
MLTPHAHAAGAGGKGALLGESMGGVAWTMLARLLPS